MPQASSYSDAKRQPTAQFWACIWSLQRPSAPRTSWITSSPMCPYGHRRANRTGGSRGTPPRRTAAGPRPRAGSRPAHGMSRSDRARSGRAHLRSDTAVRRTRTAKPRATVMRATCHPKDCRNRGSSHGRAHGHGCFSLLGRHGVSRFCNLASRRTRHPFRAPDIGTATRLPFRVAAALRRDLVLQHDAAEPGGGVAMHRRLDVLRRTRRLGPQSSESRPPGRCSPPIDHLVVRPPPASVCPGARSRRVSLAGAISGAPSYPHCRSAVAGCHPGGRAVGGDRLPGGLCNHADP